ncbi:MAG: SRPBCC family protein [Candidatus Eremiobacteraeota bacterium]|nr:SRPBCC family protein [Candidatus Eremiobacteraeota bacterium]
MNRPLTFATAVALVGVGGALIARSNKGTESEHNREASVAYGRGTRIEKAFTIDRPARELYDYWRDLTKLPSIMSHLERVEVVDAVRSRWTARGPGHFSATWDAEIVDDTPGERIAWRSVGGNVPNAGSVCFRGAPGDRGTEVRVEIEWAPPGGPFGKSLASLLGGDPALTVETDVRRFKCAMEAGTIALNGTDVKT